MKKLLLACLLFTGWSQAQNITFNDPAFKSFLVNYVYYKGQDLVGLDLNKDGEISIDEAKEPTELYIQNDSTIISTEGIENFININTLQIVSAKKIIKIDVSGISTLKNIWCLYLDELSEFIGPKNLEYLYISNSYNLSSSDFSIYPKLLDLNLANISFTTTNQFPLLLPKNITKLALINLSFSNLSPASIDFSQSLNLETLQLRDLIISNFDLSKNTKLSYIDLYNTNITKLDVTNQNLDFLYTHRNLHLSNISMKNNFKTKNLYFSENTSLKYICADEFEIDHILDTLMANGLKNVEVNSYCSFSPGGEYNTITNNVKFDSNGDCNGNDKYLSYTKFSIEDANGKGISVTDKDGIVQFYKQKGTYTLNPLLENPNFFQISPQSLNFSLNDNSGHDTTINFCISPIGVHKDLEVILSPYGPARPGFDATYLVTYKNKGNQTLSGDVSVQYNEDVLDFVRSTMSTHTSGLVSTSFVDLKPFEVKVDTLVLNVNSPIEVPAVNINDTLKFIATINPSNEDETPEDNVFAFNQRVVGAYDPNLITCLEGNVLKPTEIGKTLHYTIEFENTGNYPAENIVVVEEIDLTKYDINSIQILNTSHPMKLRIVGKKVEYYFENIDLGEHKHGNILLKLQGLKNLNEGDTVSKQADIYFDYNAPVQTNDEATVYRDLKASIATLKEDISINVYPNPGKGIVHIEAVKNIKSVDIYDVNGRVIQSKLIHTTNTEINLSNEITGMYFIKVISEEGAKVIKYQKD
jgi:hypothetical protein